MNLNLIKYLSLSAFCAAAAGCASYDNSVQQEVTFYSEDTPAVTVSLNGQVLGETTCSTVLDRAASYTVVFSKPGYRSATYELTPYADPDTGVAAFVEEVYCPELEVAPVEEAEAVAEVVPAAEEPVAEPEVPVAEPEVAPAVEEAPEAEEPAVEAEPEAEPAEEAPEVEPEAEPAAEEPVAEPEVAPAAEEEAAPEVAPAVVVPAEPETPVVAPVVKTRTLAELEAELAEIKRLRKLNLISAEEFDKRTAALAAEVARTY